MDLKNVKVKYCYMKNIKDEIVVSMLKSKIREVWKDYSSNLIIDNLDNLYVLYIKNDLIKQFKENMNEEVYNYLVKSNVGYVAGYILFYKPKKENILNKIRYIHFCDAFIPKLNIINHIINHYSNRYKMKIIVPYESIDDAIQYWLKYFSRNYGINDVEELKEFINFNKLKVNYDYNLFEKIYLAII